MAEENKEVKAEVKKVVHKVLKDSFMDKDTKEVYYKGYTYPKAGHTVDDKRIKELQDKKWID